MQRHHRAGPPIRHVAEWLIHHQAQLLIALGVLLVLAVAARLVVGNPGAARHRVRILRWRIRLYLRPGPGYANIAELMVRWSRLRAVRTGRRSRPGLPWWARLLLPVTCYAVRLGRAHLGRRVIAGMEDQALVLAAPRTGKSGWLADRIIDHPGAAMTTTTRTDLYDNAALLRGRHGAVHVFNPEGIGGLPSAFRWNPVQGCDQPAVALQRAASFTAATETRGLHDMAFWIGKASAVLASLLHAAALDGRSMSEVYQWAYGTGDEQPGQILSAHPAAAEGWLGPIRKLRRPGRTADSIRMTVTRALSWYADPAVAAATTPGPGEGFDVTGFVAAPDTLYLIGTEPVTGAQHPAVQRLQFFLSESRWDADQVNSRRLELLLADPATAPHGGGVLVIDDSGDRKDGTKTAHVGHQWLGRYGKTGNGVVTVTTVWAGERLYYPVHAVPCTPAKHFAKGKNDPGFRTKLAIGADLAIRARDAGFAFRAVAAGSAYGDQDGFRAELADAGLPFVMALKPRRGTWAYGPQAHTPADAARELAWNGPDDPGDWHPVTRAFRDGHTETWYAADATLGWWGPDGARRLVAATADPATLPHKATWYLVTSLPRPGGPRQADSPHPAASLAEIVRIYAIRNWTGQSYKQVKDELGWADFQVRSDTAIRRHQALVNCAFCFCWDAWFHDHPAPRQRTARPRTAPRRGERGPHATLLPPAPSWPRALRAIRAWLTPSIALQRWWQAWSKAPPPPQLKALMNSLTAGCGLHLYLPK